MLVADLLPGENFFRQYGNVLCPNTADFVWIRMRAQWVMR